MLVLTRKVGESLIIDDDIKITICALNNSQIRVGIQAPRNVAVHREEIYEKIKEDSRAKSGDQLIFEPAE